MQRYIKLSLFIIILISLFACKERKKYDIKIKEKEKVKLDLSIERFDRMIGSLTKDNFEKKVVEINKKSPVMFTIFYEKILGDITHSRRLKVNASMERFKTFILDKNTQELYAEVNRKYPDLDKYEKLLTNAFVHIKYYFPQDTIPRFYSIVSNFGWSAVSDRNMVIVSLDYYMGNNFKYELDPNYYPNYVKRYMKADFMVPEMIKAYFEMRFPEEEYSGKDLLSQMIYKGKMLYYLDLMMPAIEDTVKIEYSEKQFLWADKFEGEIWNQLVANNVLYSSIEEKISKYLTEAPFTNAPGLPQDTPPRIAEWLGWQIVKKYADKNSGKDRINVFFEKNAQKILSVSGYKPKIR